MGSILIILHPPGFYFLFRIVQGQEPVRVQTFIPKAAVEGFDKRVIRGFSWSGEVQRHPVLVGPFVERFGDELTPVIHLNTCFRIGSDLPNYLFQFSLCAIYACYFSLKPPVCHQNLGRNIPMPV